MLRYVLARGALLIVGLLLASLLIFSTLRVLPGDVAQVLAGIDATPAQVEAWRERLGLHVPVWQQYVTWMTGIFRGDLGTSIFGGMPVSEEIARKAIVTIPLGIYSMLIALLVAVPFGIYAAIQHGKRSSTVISWTAQTLAAVPVVWAGMMLVVVFAIWLGWLPAQGFPRAGWSDPWAAIRALTLPALTIGVVEGAMLMRFVRSATLQASTQEFVRTAAANGLTRRRALITRGIPAVGLSLISVLGLQVAGIVVGSVVIEQLFTLPGIGRMLVQDVGVRDLTKVQSELFVLTAFVLIIGFIVDLIHRWVDPREREADT